MFVTVEPYQPVWQQQFEAIKAKLSHLLRAIEYDSIQHVGSTSVPGLAAKPVIDIDIVVQRKTLISAVEALKAAGYNYYGEMGIPDRHAFKPPEQYPAQNIYICVDGSLALRNHLLVRDTCRQNKEIRDRYSQVKLQLSKQDWASINDYCMAKNEVLEWILTVSGGITSQETVEIRAMNTI